MSQEPSPTGESMGSEDLLSPDTRILLAQEIPKTNIPSLSTGQIFRRFLGFGLRGWGGAIPQIAMLKEELVIQEQWISITKFNRVYAVYQVLPGPEATELCCYFGYLAGGRLGAVVAGFAFLLPGFIAILILSYVYSMIGIHSIISRSFKALQPLVAGMVLKAVDKIGQDALYDPDTKELNIALFGIALLSAMDSILRINMFITFLVFGIAYSLHSKLLHSFSYGIVLIKYVIYTVLVSIYGFPQEQALSTGLAATPHPFQLFLLGLVAGSLSFGGAYTTIPIILQEAVVRGGWITRATFLDGVAIANVLPAPTVIFSTFVGYVGGNVYSGGETTGKGGQVGWALLGALLMTIGMFFAPFLFAVVGHPLLERLATNPAVHALFDGITAAVVGIIAVTALEIVRSAVTSGQDSISVVVFGIGLYVMYNYKFRNQVLVLVICTAIAGQVLYQ
jgi:putative chromate ion transporter